MYPKRDTWSTKNYFSLVLFLFLGLDLKTYFQGKKKKTEKQTHEAKIVRQPVSEGDMQIVS